MQIILPDTADVQAQALAAGFAMREGRRRSFEEFDAEFRGTKKDERPR